MIWIILLLILIASVSWILVSPMIIEIDTRTPCAKLRWIGLASANLSYDQEWRLSFRILFYRKTIQLSAMPARIKSTKLAKRKPLRNPHPRRMLKKIVRVIRSFRVKEWQLVIDTGDYTWNARLYPLNFARYAFGHLRINFIGENYFIIRITNRPWKMIYAFWR